MLTCPGCGHRTHPKAFTRGLYLASHWNSCRRIPLRIFHLRSVSAALPVPPSVSTQGLHNAMIFESGRPRRLKRSRAVLPWASCADGSALERTNLGKSPCIDPFTISLTYNLEYINVHHLISLTATPSETQLHQMFIPALACSVKGGFSARISCMRTSPVCQECFRHCLLIDFHGLCQWRACRLVDVKPGGLGTLLLGLKKAQLPMFRAS